MTIIEKINEENLMLLIRLLPVTPIHKISLSHPYDFDILFHECSCCLYLSVDMKLKIEKWAFNLQDTL